MVAEIRKRGGLAMMDKDCRITVTSSVLHRDLGPETVLLHLDSGVYYGLDEVGTRLWSLLVETPCLGDLHRAMMEEFEVSADQLWRDLEDFLSELQEKGLIDVRPPEDS